ncbi:hypothetical protein D3C79_1014460 [compost metagenome]
MEPPVLVPFARAGHEPRGCKNFFELDAFELRTVILFSGRLFWFLNSPLSRVPGEDLIALCPREHA